MAVLKRKTRLVSFRISDEEYQVLVATTAAQGARSISDFSRAALCQALKGDLTNLRLQPDGGLPGQVTDLIKTMRELGSVIANLSRQIEGDLAKKYT
jgi:hypothetical protein